MNRPFWEHSLGFSKEPNGRARAIRDIFLSNDLDVVVDLGYTNWIHIPYHLDYIICINV